MDSLENVQDQLAYLKSLRSEDSSEQTEDIEDESNEAEEAEEEVESAIVDESDETEEVDDDEEELFYLIDDEEVTLDQIREWKRGNLRESDYTRKTQDLAEQRKTYEAKESKLTAKEEKIDTLIADLEQAIDDRDKAIDWDELAEDDPSEFLKQQKRLEQKKAKLREAQEAKQKAAEEKRNLYFAEQQSLLIKLMPEWVDSNGATTKMQEDLKQIGDYLSKAGFSDQEMGDMIDARLWPVYRDAARYRALSEKKPETTKRVKKAPKVLKPTKARAKPSDTSILDEAKTRLKKSGSDKDALAYLKSRRA